MKKLKLLPCLLLANAALMVAVIVEGVIADAQDGVEIRNGDVNGDGARDISDASFLLNWLFLGGPPPVAFADSTELEMRVAALEEAVAALRESQPSVEEIAAELAANHADALRGEPGPQGERGPPGTPGVGGANPVAAAVESLALLLGDAEISSRVPVGALQRAGGGLRLELIKDAESFGTVVGLHIVEAVSRLPVAHVAVRVSGAEIADPDEFLGSEVMLTWVLDEEAHHFAGDVIEAALSAADSRSATYRMSIAPRFQRLASQRRSRVFQRQKYSDILRMLLGEAGVSPSNVPESAQVRDTVVQYLETDLEFASRLMEEEGTFFYFTHADGRDHVNFTSDMRLLPGVRGTFPYRGHTAPPDAIGEQYVETLHAARRPVADQVTVRQWDVARKETITAMATPSQRPNGVQIGLHEDFLGERRSPAEADLEATVRRELLDLDSQLLDGTSTIAALRAGHVVTIAGVGDAFSGKYFVSSVNHTFVTVDTGGRPAFYHGNSFRCSPADVQYRPRRLTPRPRIDGLQTAIVVDNESEDSSPRVRVRFPWLDEGGASAWIRLGSIGAGRERGFQWMPEIDDEVLVGFMQGDPSYPVVVGSLWNGKDAPPLAPPESRDQRIIQTRSGHALVFDDTEGAEQVAMSSVQDLVLDSGELLELQSRGPASLASEKGVELSSGLDFTVDSSAAVKIQAAASVEVVSAVTRITSSLVSLDSTTRVNGALVVDSNAGPASGVAPGQRSRDNAIVAWARVGAGGATGDAQFGVTAVEHPQPGVYRITLSRAAASAGELIPIAVARVRGQPTTPRELRFVSVNQVGQDAFEVYVNRGDVIPVDAPFVFMATAR